jgi:SAM-dependent methyltransferase
MTQPLTDAAVPAPHHAEELGSATKDRTQFSRVLSDCIRDCGVDVSGHVLIVGGSFEDASVLFRAGFRRITLSNLMSLDTIQQNEAERAPRIEGAVIDLVSEDVEDCHLPDGSYDLVLAHEVLHHCRSPHKALLEMLRVARKHVVIMEPNDSAAMNAMVRMGFSFPYELPAVIDHNYESGGVRNSCVPNYIFRWNKRDMFQSAASFMPESDFNLYVRQYWDFNVDKNDLALRQQTRIGAFTRVLGPDLFLATLHAFQAVVNRLPVVGAQGNKFFGCITKQAQLKPWLRHDGNRVIFNRQFGNCA